MRNLGSWVERGRKESNGHALTGGHTYNPNTRVCVCGGAGDQEFKVIFNYIASLRPAWERSNPVSRKREGWREGREPPAEALTSMPDPFPHSLHCGYSESTDGLWGGNVLAPVQRCFLGCWGSRGRSH